MLPGWDKLQDLRGQIAGKSAEKPQPDQITQAVTSTDTLADAADKIVAARVLHTLANKDRESKRVSKLGAIAERIAAKKQAHDAKADEWALRLDALDKREPDAFAIGDAVIAERETDLSDMERSMRTISNLPNVVSGKS